MIFSESTENIFKALAEFKKEFKQPKKDTENPFFKSKYVDLDAVVDSLDSIIPDYKLGYTQNVTTDENGRVGVQTIILHESGEHIEFDWLFIKPDKNTAQGIGSAITYGRRYTLTSAFGIASEVDDDGNEASGKTINNNQPKIELVNQADIKKIEDKLMELSTISEGDVEENKKKYTHWIIGQAKVNSIKEIRKDFVGSLLNVLDRMIAKEQEKQTQAESAEQTSLLEGNTTKPKENSK